MPIPQPEAPHITDNPAHMRVVQEGMMTIAKPIGLADRKDATALTVPHGEIRFEDVSFGYPGGPLVLRDVDEHLARSGRVVEILSEHTCQGWLEGYLLTGRHGLFPCYEAFLPIVDALRRFLVLL